MRARGGGTKGARRTPAYQAFPVFLDLRSLPVLVVGGGAVAARKARGLLRAGAAVRAVAKRFGEEMRGLAGLRRFQRAFRVSDLRGARLVCAATGDPALNARIARSAEERGAFANVASPPEAGRASLPGLFRRGRFAVAVSTGGASAGLAAELRRHLARQVDEAWPALLELLAARRAAILRGVRDPVRRRRLLRALGSRKWLAVVRREGRAKAGARMDELIAHAARRGCESGTHGRL